METSKPVAPANVDGARVALVHDWLTGMRGGEKALEALTDLLPNAQLFTLLHVPGTVSPKLEETRPRQSFIRLLPWARQHYRRYIPLFPIAVEQFDLDEFDLVVSTSHCAAKSVVTPGRARHLCYCFTPMRYAWDQFDAYFGPQRVGAWRSRLYRLAFNRLARWDAHTAGRVDRYVAISQHVAARIRRYYNREATVVYPPVDTTFYSPNGSAPLPYFLIVSALVPYKRVDLAIEACRIAGVPLHVAGNGPEMARLKALAGQDVEFLGACSDLELRALYREAQALLLPGEEDFGIAPVEALACGRPVVGLAKGGVTEIVSDGDTGVLVEEPSAEAFADGIRRIAATSFDPVHLRAQALRFAQPTLPPRDARLYRRNAQDIRRRGVMITRQTRVLVAFHVLLDGLLGAFAFALAYTLRFETFLAAPKGQPPFTQYLVLVPFIALLVPLAFNLQGAYRLRHSRTRVDDFFSVLVGNVLVVVIGLLGTTYFQVYYATGEAQTAGAYEVSRLVWGLFLGINVVLTYSSREIPRQLSQRRFKAGLGLKRVLIAGTGDLARHVADKILQHSEFGYQVVGFVDDSAGSDTLGYRGLPLLGPLDDAQELIQQEQIDQLYVALPLEEHVKMLGLIEVANRECVDVKVVPDLLQFIALRARLEDLDGVPIININDVPLQGLNSAIKRAIDIAISSVALVGLGGAVRRDRGGDPSQLPGPGLLHTGAHGPGPAPVHGPQVQVDVRKRRAGHWTRLGKGERPAPYAGRHHPTTVQRRRAPAALERSARRHVARRARGPSVRSSSISSRTASPSTCFGTRSSRG